MSPDDYFRAREERQLRDFSAKVQHDRYGIGVLKLSQEEALALAPPDRVKTDQTEYFKKYEADRARNCIVCGTKIYRTSTWCRDCKPRAPKPVIIPNTRIMEGAKWAN